MNSGHRPALSLVPLALLALLLIFGVGRQEREARSTAGNALKPNLRKFDQARARPNSAEDPTTAAPQMTAIETALAAGIPLHVWGDSSSGDTDGPDEFTLQVRPMRALADDFQITLGADHSRTVDTEPTVFEGWAVSPAGVSCGRATAAMVNGAFAAMVRHPDGAVTELKTDPATGALRILRLASNTSDQCCSMTDTPLGTVASMRSEHAPFSEEDWGAADIMPQWGSDPGTGKITKYEQPIPNGALYDRSLPDATVMVVLAKDATGTEDPENLASRASTYLARMANVGTIWENQLGIRLLVSELILTPDTPSYEGVGETLGDFRTWAEINRPRFEFPRSIAARFGDLGFTGTVIGEAFLDGVGGRRGYSINKTNYNFTLVGHEMGHNFGANHSTGGIMNGKHQSGARDFFRDVNPGETAAMQIYQDSRFPLIGPAPLRNPEEIPFARDDSLVTSVDTPLLLEPLLNDDASVLNGATNALSIAEVSRVFPAGAGQAEVLDSSIVVFTPASGFEGFAWFSYSLQGDVGNNGQGWLHRGDVAVLVGVDPNDDTQLTLAPGESVIFDPPGSGDATITSPASQALVDVTRDDRTFLVIRAAATATGTDAFVVQRGGASHTIALTYEPRLPVAQPDVLALDPSSSSLRFNPMSNDTGAGYRRPLRRGARIGVDGNTEDYFPNAFRLISATNLNPEKGSLTIEKLDLVRNGVNQSVPTGFLEFMASPGANGVANIEDVIEDAAGNQSSGISSIVLSLLEITSPSAGNIDLPPGVGLLIEGNTSSSNLGSLSGVVAVNWEVLSSPPGSNVTISNLGTINTAVRFSGPGTYTLRAIGKDGGLATSQDLTVTVTTGTPASGNLAAMVSLANTAINVGTAGPFALSFAGPMVNDDGLPTPPVTTTTQWSQISGPGPVIFSNVALLSSTAIFPFPGRYVLRLTANDGTVQTFEELTVDYTGPGNGVPVTSGISDQQLPLDPDDVTIPLFPAFEDGEDSDAQLACSVVGNTNPDLFDTVTISGDPEELVLRFLPEASGSGQLTIRATDTDGNSVDTTFMVNVSNAPPEITPIADQLVFEGQTLNLQVLASDPDGDTLTFSLAAGSPPGMSIDPASGALSWTPGESVSPATYPVVVQAVEDSFQALSAVQVFRVTVAPAPEGVYEDWIVGFPQLQGDDRLPESDPDGDRMSNYFEFCFGWIPTLQEQQGLGQSQPVLLASSVNSGSPPSVELRYRRRINYQSQGLDYELQSSPTATEASWMLASTQVSAPPEPTGDGVTEIITVQVFSSGPVPSGQFFRVMASSPFGP